MKKQIVRLNESQLTKIIKENVKKVLNEKVLPVYYKDDYNDDDDYDDDFLFKGEDMFSEDLLHIAEKVNKLVGGQLTVSTDGKSSIFMYTTGTLSLESLEKIIKITKYLHLDKVYLPLDRVWWNVFGKVGDIPDGINSITLGTNHSASLEVLELLVKITKYLQLDGVNVSEGKGRKRIVWALPNNFNKSRKVQVGDKYFDMNDVPLEWQVRKPEVIHQSYPNN